MIDFHCHLDLYPDPDKVVSECIKRKIYLLSVTTTPASWTRTYAIANNAPRIRTAIGLHPQLIHQRKIELSMLLKGLRLTRYVGEVGIDGGPDYRGSIAEQLYVFDTILHECSKIGGRVLSIHSRRATGMVLDALSRWPGCGVPVLHWFTGTKRELAHAVDLGCWFSVGPSMLNTQNGIQLAKCMPRDRILTESDGPFAKLRSRPAFPWDVEEAEMALSRIWGISLAEASAQLEGNLRQLSSMSAHFPR